MCQTALPMDNPFIDASFVRASSVIFIFCSGVRDRRCIDRTGVSPAAETREDDVKSTDRVVQFYYYTKLV